MIPLPTSEEFLARLESMPEPLLSAIQSEETVSLLSKIEVDFGLERERLVVISQLVGLVVCGFADKEDLIELITEAIEVEGGVAEKICIDLDEGLFGRIKNNLDEFLVSIAVPKNKVLKPNVQVQQTETITPSASPFILHEHKDIESARGTINYAGDLAKPSFHVSENYGESAEEHFGSIPNARLELGDQAGSRIYIEPKTTRVGREEARVVHYSAPDIQVDPFSRTPEPVLKPTQEPVPQLSKTSVPHDNVVNLKDLPK